MFLDSDLLTEADWLRTLVGEFSDFRRIVVVGRTHFETRTLYERAVALFWIFETRDPSTAVRRTDRFVSNNVGVPPRAVRAPAVSGPADLSRPVQRARRDARRAADHRLRTAGGARLSPGAGRRARFISRALHAGKDQLFYDRLSGRVGLGDCVRQWRTDLDNVGKRIRRRAPRSAPDG